MEDFSTTNSITYFLELSGYIQEGDTNGFMKMKFNSTISLSYSILSQTMSILNLTSWVFYKHRQSFIMINHFIKTDKGQEYFETELEKYISLIDRISNTEFAEYFYIIYCGPLNVRVEKEIFETQNIFCFYMNIDSSYDDIKKIANYRST